MSLAEALAAATINSAHSIGRGATHGSIQENKVNNLVVKSIVFSLATIPENVFNINLKNINKIK